MSILNRIDNYLSDREYKIIIKENIVDIINYDEIVNFSPMIVSVKHHNKVITVEGRNLVINKMIEDEVLITVSITNISIK